MESCSAFEMFQKEKQSQLKEIFNSNPTEQVEISSLGDFADLNSL
jgi:hypothetical protein